MGIYISGVKGLPEQVQANKEDIKEVKEQIEGIDFDSIRELQGQVAENTQDINNLEASIGVQNQTINALGDRATALERKTQLMSYNDDTSMTDFRNSIEVADDVVATGIHVAGDGVMVNSKGSGLHFQEGANDDTLTIANQDGAVAHFLHFNADGTLDIDGNPVGGGLHTHIIGLYSNSFQFAAYLIWFSSRETPFTTIGEIAAEIYAKGIDGTSNKALMASGNNTTGTASPINRVYAYSNTELRFANIQGNTYSTLGSVDFTDIVL